jgi:hypothetical protein
LFVQRKVVRAIMMACEYSIDDLAAPGIVVGKRLISDGDEGALLPEEAAALAGSVWRCAYCRARALGAVGLLKYDRFAESDFRSTHLAAVAFSTLDSVFPQAL